MTIEITRGDNTFLYRIAPTDPLLIERRANTHGARWGFYKVCDSPNDAKRALLAIGSEGQEEEGKRKHKVLED